ncbi:MULTISPECIES: hypothetical protein [unclassified Streptomyces]|uniref:hypothetical protein n=1 Tax=unclassified Streptomyces TaxID=2593676 RepID=UPI000FB00107|nr:MULTISPECIES: hypothetical protein [unclassified Streptomyces]RPK69000.1 hypothetical protein EES42_19965 [Streptomyces sp. ADI95-17]
MVRAGQPPEKAAPIHQHSDLERRQEVASGLDDLVRAAREKADENPSGAGRLKWSRQQRSPGRSAWAFIMERVTRIELAL